MKLWHWVVLGIVAAGVAVCISDVYTQEVERIEPATVTHTVRHYDENGAAGWTWHTNRGSFYMYRDYTGGRVYVTTWVGWTGIPTREVTCEQ